MAARKSKPRAPGASAEPDASGANGGDPPAVIGFEEALERLESLVERLDDGDLPLEAALAAFEEGVALTRQCAHQLQSAERRVEALVREGGRLIERPFEVEEEGS
jgi:exodeoxyribonuclease VII small subunit